MVLNSNVANISFFLLLIFFLTACGMSRHGAYPDRSGPDRELTADSRGVATGHVVALLNSAHLEWAGTPYQLGGNSQSGIDCSAFTKVVFENYFETQIPRHTSEQLQAGNGVRRNFIRPGDLVFFRTARGVLHVGIAMDNDRFLHASVSSGVMISSLRESYWATRYIGTRRVL